MPAARFRPPLPRCLRWLPILCAALFAPWCPVAGQERTAPVRDMVEMPFDFSQGVIILDVDYGGSRPAKVVLDTGDADSLLDLAAARAIDLPLDMTQLKAAGSGEGAVTFYQTTPPRARLGGAEFARTPLIVMPVAQHLLEDSGIRCEGTLGYDFFKGRVVQIDYPARKLRLLPAAPPVADGADVPVQWRKYHDTSPLLVTTDALKIGEHAVVAQIDTCFARSLILFTTKLPWLETRPAGPGVAPVTYENATLQPAMLPVPVSLGSLRFRTNPVAYLAGADASVPTTEIAAVLGNSFFENGVLTLDFRTDRLTATRKE